MSVLLSRWALARQLKVDPRTIANLGLMPAGQDAHGVPLFELESARKRLEAYRCNAPRKRPTRKPGITVIPADWLTAAGEGPIKQIFKMKWIASLSQDSLF
jgi:hypothetical protein